MTTSKKSNLDEATLQIARRMLNTPPKPHEEMKIGKRKADQSKIPAKRKLGANRRG
jgi:hypothetical protein